MNFNQNVQEPNDINSSGPTICLCMIVKNESRIICRLFDSIVNIINVFCICDTGSTDDTVQIIREYWKSKNINGLMIGYPFIDFSTNRNVAINACTGLSDYILLLDADMELVINGFDKNCIIPYDEIGIQQESSGLSCVNTRIIKNNAQYIYRGVTHETIEHVNAPKFKYVTMSPEIIKINDYGDGSNRMHRLKVGRLVDILSLNNKTYTSAESSVFKTQVGNVLMNANVSIIHNVINILPNINTDTDVWTIIDRDEKFGSSTIDIASFINLESDSELLSFSIINHNNSGYYVNLCTKTSSDKYLNTTILLDNLFNHLYSANIEDRILCCQHKFQLITSNNKTPIYILSGIETNKMLIGVYNINSSLVFNSNSVDMTFEMTSACSPFAINNSVAVVTKWYPLQICVFGNIGIKTIVNTPCIFNFVVSSTNGCWFDNELWFLLTANIENSTNSSSTEFYFFAKFNLTMSSIICSIPFVCNSDLRNLNFGSLIIESEKVICVLSENNDLKNFHIKTYSKAGVDSLFI